MKAQTKTKNPQAQKEGGRGLACDGTELGSMTCDELSFEFGQRFIKFPIL